MPDSSPLFTIGIPTFNRVEFLRTSLAAALAQQCDSLEIVVSDNGSEDGTEAFCRGISDPRLRYFRSDVNRGACWNFGRCLELARGRYFSWLQDDDLIFPDFANRAARTLESTHSDCYLGTAICSPTPSFIYWDSLYSPPLNLHWGQSGSVSVPFSLMAPLSLLASVAIPPVIAFRTEFLRGIVCWFIDTDCPLFAERLLLVAAAKSGCVVAAPHVAGVFRIHQHQMHVSMMNDAGRSLAEWTRFTEKIQSLNPDFDLTVFREYVAGLPDTHLKTFIRNLNGKAVDSQFSAGVLQILTSQAASRWPQMEIVSTKPTNTPIQFLKNVITQVMPPVALVTLKAARRRLSR